MQVDHGKNSITVGHEYESNNLFIANNSKISSTRWIWLTDIRVLCWRYLNSPWIRLQSPTLLEYTIVYRYMPLKNISLRIDATCTHTHMFHKSKTSEKVSRKLSA